jgi:hypothetical protein
LRNRPDLLDEARLSDEDKDLLAEIQASSSWPLGY